jgi:hypothetical protein
LNKRASVKKLCTRFNEEISQGIIVADVNYGVVTVQNNILVARLHKAIPYGHVLDQSENTARENKQKSNDADNANDVQSDEHIWKKKATVRNAAHHKQLITDMHEEASLSEYSQWRMHRDVIKERK